MTLKVAGIKDFCVILQAQTQATQFRKRLERLQGGSTTY